MNFLGRGDRIEAAGNENQAARPRASPAPGDHPGGRGPQSPMAAATAAGSGDTGAESSWSFRRPRHGQTGGFLPPPTMNERLRSVIAMGLFVVLAGYVGFSAIRLGLLLWQRFGAG